MKIIDLLNKIAKGEEVPKKIDYNREIFIYNEALKRYVNEIDKYSDSSTYCLGGYFALDMSLDHEVKVLEEVEDKEYEDIKTIRIDENGYLHSAFGSCKGRKVDVDIANKINTLIRNQKKIIERIKNDIK